MKLKETCEFQPKGYIVCSNDFVCEHPILLYEEHSGNYGTIYECPICNQKFYTEKNEVSKEALDNRYLIKTMGNSTRHYQYAILSLLRSISFNLTNYYCVDIVKILKELNYEIKQYLTKTSPIVQYKETVEPKIKRLSIGDL